MAEGLTIDVTTEDIIIDVVLNGVVIFPAATFVTPAQLATALEDYVETTDLATDLADYALKAPSVNLQTGTSYDLQQSDNNKVLEFSSASAKDVNVLNNLTGFQCTIVNTGTGKLTIQEGSGVTIYSKDGNLSIDDQYGAATIYSSGSNIYIAFGNLVT